MTGRLRPDAPPTRPQILPRRSRGTAFGYSTRSLVTASCNPHLSGSVSGGGAPSPKAAMEVRSDVLSDRFGDPDPDPEADMSAPASSWR
jgi:hypothetical protein